MVFVKSYYKNTRRSVRRYTKEKVKSKNRVILVRQYQETPKHPVGCLRASSTKLTVTEYVTINLRHKTRTDGHIVQIRLSTYLMELSSRNLARSGRRVAWVCGKRFDKCVAWLDERGKERGQLLTGLVRSFCHTT